MTDKWWMENIAKNTKTYLSADTYINQEKIHPLSIGGTVSSAATRKEVQFLMLPLERRYSF